MYFNQISNNSVETAALILSEYDAVRSEFASWLIPLLDSQQIKYTSKASMRRIDEAFGLARPFSGGSPRRRVILEIRSGLCLYFDDHIHGGGATTVAPVLSERLACAVIRITDTATSLPARVFQLYDAARESSRWLSWVDDGNGMEFAFSGNRLAYENKLDPFTSVPITPSELAAIVSAAGATLDFNPEQIARCAIIEIE